MPNRISEALSGDDIDASILSLHQYILSLQKQLTDTERIEFRHEYNASKKNTTTAIILAALIGGLGAHRFYMGEIGLGIVYAVFCWTFIPALAALIECFLLPERVRRHNTKTATSIYNAIKLVRNRETPPSLIHSP